METEQKNNFTKEKHLNWKKLPDECTCKWGEGEWCKGMRLFADLYLCILDKEYCLVTVPNLM